MNTHFFSRSTQMMRRALPRQPWTVLRLLLTLVLLVNALSAAPQTAQAKPQTALTQTLFYDAFPNSSQISNLTQTAGNFTPYSSAYGGTQVMRLFALLDSLNPSSRIGGANYADIWVPTVVNGSGSVSGDTANGGMLVVAGPNASTTSQVSAYYNAYTAVSSFRTIVNFMVKTTPTSYSKSQIGFNYLATDGTVNRIFITVDNTLNAYGASMTDGYTQGGTANTAGFAPINVGSWYQATLTYPGSSASNVQMCVGTSCIYFTLPKAYSSFRQVELASRVYHSSATAQTQTVFGTAQHAYGVTGTVISNAFMPHSGYCYATLTGSATLNAGTLTVDVLNSNTGGVLISNASLSGTSLSGISCATPIKLRATLTKPSGTQLGATLSYWQVTENDVTAPTFAYPTFSPGASIWAPSKQVTATASDNGGSVQTTYCKLGYESGYTPVYGNTCSRTAIANTTFSYYATDGANTSAVSSVSVSYIDALSPASGKNFSVSPSTPSATPVTATITVGDDTGGSGARGINCAKTSSVSTNDTTAQTCSQVYSYNGILYYRSKDNAGNWSSVGSSLITNLTVSPPVTSVTVPSSANGYIPVSWQSAPEALTMFRLEAQDTAVGTWTRLLDRSQATSYNFEGPVSGHTYKFRVQSFDDYGGQSAWTESGTCLITPVGIRKYYKFGSQTVAMRSNGAVTYFAGDQVSSTSVVTSDTGQVIAQSRYKPYGEVASVSGVSGQLPTDKTYTGQRFESFGLMDYGARFYDSGLGRFISPDPIVPTIGEGNNPIAIGFLANANNSALVVDYHENQFLSQLNLENQARLHSPQVHSPFVPRNPLAFDRYAYAFNNPIQYNDPSGHNPIIIGLIAIGPIGWAALGLVAVGAVIYFAAGGPEKVGNGINQAVNSYNEQVALNGADQSRQLGYQSAEQLGNSLGANLAQASTDTNHTGADAYDKALENAQKNAGDLGEDSQKMYDPETGTLIGEQSADGKSGWRIDEGHVNWWDWTQGKKNSGGRYGHEYFPEEQNGPNSKYNGYAPWE